MRVHLNFNLLFLTILFLFLLIILPFLNIESIVNLTVLPFLILIYIGLSSILKNFKALNLALLGYGALIFLDIIKFDILDFREIQSNVKYLTIYLSYTSVFTFLVFYQVCSLRFRVPSGKNLFFHKQRIVYFFAPLSIVLLIFYIFLIENAPSLSQSPLLLLISFLPKAMIIVSLYIYIKSNNKYFLYLFLILIFLSFAESSRRIYITIFFILLPLIISYIYQRHGKISFIHKLNFSIVLIIFFIFLNFLRSSHDFGEGYEEDSEILNTINYIQNMRSIDTFYNTSFIIENFPNNYNYYYGETYFAALVMFIPRSIWNEKPVSFAAPLGVLQRLDTQDFTFEDWNSINQFSLSPGFIGEAWANFGILGVIILSALFGAFTRIIDNTVNIIDIVRNINLLPYLSYYGAAFILLRGDFFSAVYFTIFFYIYLKLLVKFGTFRA